MRRLLVALCFALVPVLATAGGGSNEALDEVHVDLSDKASLQRGARTFVNYCLSCHSAGYMRYERMAADLDISDQLLRENLMFATSKPGELMTVTMSDEGAKDWFGVVPPDLSLTARSHGSDWIYTYMRSFYRDDSTVTGWNNLLFPNVAMPHVLYRWQGTRDARFEEQDGVQEFVGFEDRALGELSPDEYDAAVRDLTNFMVYLAEPAKLVRYKIGFWVMVFMGILILLSYALKREYWRDIH